MGGLDIAGGGGKSEEIEPKVGATYEQRTFTVGEEANAADAAATVDEMAAKIGREEIGKVNEVGGLEGAPKNSEAEGDEDPAGKFGPEEARQLFFQGVQVHESPIKEVMQGEPGIKDKDIEDMPPNFG